MFRPEQITFAVNCRMGCIGVGIKMADLNKPGRFFPNLIRNVAMLRDPGPWNIYVSIATMPGVRIRLSCLGAIEVPELPSPIGTNGSRQNLSLLKAARAAAILGRSRSELRRAALNCGMPAHEYDYIFFPALAQSAAPSNDEIRNFRSTALKQWQKEIDSAEQLNYETMSDWYKPDIIESMTNFRDEVYKNMDVQNAAELLNTF